MNPICCVFRVLKYTFILHLLEAQSVITNSSCYYVYVCLLAAQSRPILCDPMGYKAHQAPLPVGFLRQEYQSGLPFPSPGALPHPGIESGSPALQADSHLSHQGSYTR